MALNIQKTDELPPLKQPLRIIEPGPEWSSNWFDERQARLQCLNEALRPSSNGGAAALGFGLLLIAGAAASRARKKR